LWWLKLPVTMVAQNLPKGSVGCNWNHVENMWSWGSMDTSNSGFAILLCYSRSLRWCNITMTNDLLLNREVFGVCWIGIWFSWSPDEVKCKEIKILDRQYDSQNLMATFCPLAVGIREKVSRILITLTYLLSASNI
jgi:hypothetical protein